MYTISEYGDMIHDHIRTDAYVKALEQVVKPGSVVLDLGAGTGFFSMLACRFGARKVYAIEAADVIQLAREVAAENNYADRIEFIQGESTSVKLPEQADVMISDLRGMLPLFRRSIASIIDARKRLLHPKAALIPLQDTIWASVVEAPKAYRHIDQWDSSVYGLKHDKARQLVANSWWKVRVEPTQMLTEPGCWTTIDYATINNPDVRAEIQWTVSRPGIGHGLVVWFDSTFAEGVGISNRPGNPELVYGRVFFPWLKPVQFAPGDTVSVAISADMVTGYYNWRWESRVLAQGDATKILADFKQSTFFSTAPSAAQLRKRSGSHLPKLNEDGQIDSFVLANMNGKTPSEQIAHLLTNLYPERFATFKDALTRVGELAQEYSE